MSSIIEGYEYDIFISYRQKDNKGDKWVSEFVEALKTELESTFKEEISVYFDINPYDGLLETHDVDASLQDKIKCLVFIPIISRTYCDPKSFAWENEFKVFVELASHDQFGLKVKLPNGNVASRILPIRIHDLDAYDLKLCESVMGGVMRGVEFIYKEQGVNRSLVPGDDEKKNFNNTRYRNQINKVALAAREILLVLKAEKGKTERDGSQQRVLPGEDFKAEKKISRDKLSNRITLLSGAIVLAILILAAILWYLKIFRQNKLGLENSSDGRISIAIMPFQNMTNDTIWNVWQDGIQNELINNLTNYKELKVRQTKSISDIIEREGFKNYTSLTPPLAGVISRKLDARVFLYGSIKQAGNILRVNAQLINTKTEDLFKSFNIEGIASEDMIFKIIDSLSAQIKNFLIITELGKELNSIEQKNVITNLPEAYRYYIYGLKAFNKSDLSAALNWYSQAVRIDSNFIAAVSYLSWTYRNLGMTEQAKKWCLWLYKKRDTLPLYWKLHTDWTYSTYFETPKESLKILMQLQELDDQLNIHFLIGMTYMSLFQYDKATIEYEKSKKLFNELEDFSIFDYTALGSAYHQAGQYRKEKKLYKQAEKLFPENPELKALQTVLALSQGDTISANRYEEQWVSIQREVSEPEASIVLSLGWIHNDAGCLKQAEAYFRKALSMEPDDPEMMGALAWFLIDKDRSVNEGMELNERLMAMNPNYDYHALATTGWGLYKQGKLKESQETLEKAWDLRDCYNPDLYRCIQEVNQAIANQKDN